MNLVSSKPRAPLEERLGSSVAMTMAFQGTIDPGFFVRLIVASEADSDKLFVCGNYIIL